MKGFVKVTAMSPIVTLGDVKQNVFHMTNCFNAFFDSWNSDVIVFPELGLTGSTIGDLFTHSNLIMGDVWSGIEELCRFQIDIKSSSDHCPIFIIGAPIEYLGNLYDCALVLKDGAVEGIVPKCHINKKFSRWFTSGAAIKDKLINGKIKFGSDLIFDTDLFKFAIEIGDDRTALIHPSSLACLAGAEIIFNPSSDCEGIEDYWSKVSHIASLSKKCLCGYVYTSSGYGESSGTEIYIPEASIYEVGHVVKITDYQFNNVTDYRSSTSEIDLNKIRLTRRCNTSFRDQNIIDGFRYVSLAPRKTDFGHITRRYSSDVFEHVDLEYIFNLQVTGLMRRLNVTSGNIVIGVSGGSDSTLALLVSYEALKRRGNKDEMIYGITMPCYGTTDRTKDNSLKLMEVLSDKVISKKILISRSVTQHRKDIELDKDDRSITYENCQARERTQVLMDYANKVGGIVVGTGDLSELALGWCTYNADHMSMYNVNVGVPKTVVKKIIQWYTDEYCRNNTVLFDILIDIINTPVSPELLPDQVTEDQIGPYELHEFFLYHTLKSGWDKNTILEIATISFANSYDINTIKKWLNVFYRRFMNQQFKRNCLPDGPRVLDLGLSPHGDWIMPSDLPIKFKI